MKRDGEARRGEEKYQLLNKARRGEQRHGETRRMTKRLRKASRGRESHRVTDKRGEA